MQSLSTRALARRTLAFSTSVGAAALLLACGGGGGDDTPLPVDQPSGPTPVSIAFAASANGTAVNCQTTLTALGTTRIDAALRDLRFYVSEIHLLDRQGNRVPVELDANEWQVPAASLALVDLEDGSGACADAGTPELNPHITGQVPAGDYAGLEFTLGVPGSLNHTDTTTTAAPLDLQALSWSWQAGRKFFQVEVNPEGGVARPAPAAPGKSFFVHLGSTGCTGNPVTGETVSCERPNRMKVVFDAFDFERQQVVLDAAQLFSQSHIGEDLGGAPGCMSGMADPECAAIFSRLGLDLTLGTPLGGTSQQDVFLVKDKP